MHPIFKFIRTILVTLFLLLTLHINYVSAADDDLRHPDDTSLRAYDRLVDNNYYSQATLPAHSTTSLDASSRINDIFNRLGAAGDAYNSGGQDAVTQALLENGCQLAIAQATDSSLLTGLQSDIESFSLCSLVPPAPFSRLKQNN